LSPPKLALNYLKPGTIFYLVTFLCNPIEGLLNSLLNPRFGLIAQNLRCLLDRGSPASNLILVYSLILSSRFKVLCLIFGIFPKTLHPSLYFPSSLSSTHALSLTQPRIPFATCSPRVSSLSQRRIKAGAWHPSFSSPYIPPLPYCL